MPDLFIVITEDKELCTHILSPSLHHESSADCERGREVFLLKRGMRVTVGLVNFVIIVQREVKGRQRRTEWNWIVLRYSKAIHSPQTCCSPTSLTVATHLTSLFPVLQHRWRPNSFTSTQVQSIEYQKYQVPSHVTKCISNKYQKYPVPTCTGTRAQRMRLELLFLQKSRSPQLTYWSHHWQGYYLR